MKEYTLLYCIPNLIAKLVHQSPLCGEVFADYYCFIIIIIYGGGIMDREIYCYCYCKLLCRLK